MTFQIKFKANNKGKEYKVEEIQDGAAYTKESGIHLQELYYLVLWKSYPKEENTWEPALVMQYLWNLINTFHKDHSEKLTAISPLIDIASPKAKPTHRPETEATKQKRGQLTKTNGAKYAKKIWEIKFLSHFWSCLSQK